MKKLSLKSLRDKLNNNFMLNDYIYIDVKPLEEGTQNEFTIFYKHCIIRLTPVEFGFMVSVEGFITLIKVEYLVDFVKGLERVLVK